MKTDFRHSDQHEQARWLSALSSPEEELSSLERAWLDEHLESCASCREFVESANETIRAVRAISIAAGANLVSATQARLRQRAQELQRHQERVWLVWTCCAVVTLCSTLNTALLWRWLAWLGEWLGEQWMGRQGPLSTALFEVGFLALCLMPAIVTGVILLARGTYLEGDLEHGNQA